MYEVGRQVLKKEAAQVCRKEMMQMCRKVDQERDKQAVQVLEVVV